MMNDEQQMIIENFSVNRKGCREIEANRKVWSLSGLHCCNVVSLFIRQIRFYYSPS